MKRHLHNEFLDTKRSFECPAHKSTNFSVVERVTQDVQRSIVGGEEVLRGGREKPSRDIFLKACRVAGCAPREAAHVGDSLATDVQVMRA